MSTATIYEQRQAIDARRQREYEDFQRFEQECRWRDELTDVAERVRAPLARTVEFFLTPTGLTNDLGQDLRQIIVDGLEDARLQAATQPDWQVEVERREIDLAEYDDIAMLAAHGQGTIVSYWMIPDAVRDSHSDLPGYNRERLKMFTRVAQATKTGVQIRYHSYDGSNDDGIAAMDTTLGFDFIYGRSSEQVARERRYLPEHKGDIDQLDEQLRQAYDGALAKKYGGKWYGGRPAIAQTEAFGFVSQQSDLIDEHMAIINQIFALTSDPRERNLLAESHRYNFAAALDGRLHGRSVDSLQAAGDTARAEGRDFSGDCPPAAGAVLQLESVGFKAKKDNLNCVRCPLPGCGKVVDAVRTPEGGIKCPACQREVRDGKTIDHAKQAKVVKNVGRNAGVASGLVRPTNRHRVHDRRTRHKERLVVGGTTRYTVDTSTGQKIADGWH